MRALDLFCCEGGASTGLHQAGFDVTGVDIRPQPRYPFKFILGDALMAPIDFRQFDLIWASPPCQAHTLAQRIRGNDHSNLIDPTRNALKASGVHYVIENVVGAPLVNPVMLCGSMFTLQTYRHRLFECSFPVTTPHHPDHMAPNRKMGRPVRDGEMMHIVGNFSGAQRARDIMATPWMTRRGLREAIPPVYSKYIAEQFLNRSRLSST